MKITGYIKKYRLDAILAPLLKLSEAALELAIPIFVAAMIDEGVNGKDGGAIWTYGLLMALFALLGLAFSIAGQFFSARAAAGFASEVRGALYKKLLYSPLAVTDETGVSAMITRMTSDINQTQSGVNLFLRLLLRSPFVVVGAFIAAAIINLKISLIFLATIIFLFAVVSAIMKFSIPKYREAQKKLDEVSRIARENLTGARVVRAFSATESEIKDYERATAAHEKLQNAAAAISAILSPVTFAAVNFAIVALIYSGAISVYGGVLTQGAVVALYDYMSQILVELVKFVNLVITVSRSLVCAKRIDKILSDERQKEFTEKKKISDCFVEFDHVSVTYSDGTKALDDISFRVSENMTVGIIGGTGSGKSTLVNLLPRLYDATEGRVSVGGYDIKSYSSEELGEMTGIALQRPALFKGTIADNIRLGNEKIDDNGVIAALIAAQAGDFVKGDRGINSPVEQGGRNFSGGQKQRIGIARALAKRPKILILDDSSSALDYATDLALRRAISSLPYEHTSFIVSQRTASVKNADLIIVLDDGKIVGIGKHEDLLENCEVYRETEASQTKGDTDRE
ncbi:MAG: ABC transporter ATP-binding protein [Clostridia bacterium]|nr:ABC transporter ATP-binding protein [Clostridia bacterium]